MLDVRKVWNYYELFYTDVGIHGAQELSAYSFLNKKNKILEIEEAKPLTFHGASTLLLTKCATLFSVTLQKSYCLGSEAASRSDPIEDMK